MSDSNALHTNHLRLILSLDLTQTENVHTQLI